MANTHDRPVIRAIELGGHTFYGAVLCGVEYLASQVGDGWYVTECVNVPGTLPMVVSRDYPDLATMAAHCKAFAGLDLLVHADALCA